MPKQLRCCVAVALLHIVFPLPLPLILSRPVCSQNACNCCWVQSKRGGGKQRESVALGAWESVSVRECWITCAIAANNTKVNIVCVCMCEEARVLPLLWAQAAFRCHAAARCVSARLCVCNNNYKLNNYTTQAKIKQLGTDCRRCCRCSCSGTPVKQRQHYQKQQQQLLLKQQKSSHCRAQLRMQSVSQQHNENSKQQQHKMLWNQSNFPLRKGIKNSVRETDREGEEKL